MSGIHALPSYHANALTASPLDGINLKGGREMKEVQCENRDLAWIKGNEAIEQGYKFQVTYCTTFAKQSMLPPQRRSPASRGFLLYTNQIRHPGFLSASALTASLKGRIYLPV